MDDMVNLTQLTRVLGKSAPTVRNYIARGMPVITEADRKNGKEWEFSKKDCMEWFEDYQLNLFEQQREREEAALDDEDDDKLRAARLEKLKIETARLELRLKREQGELVPIESIARIVEQQFTSIRQQLLSIPHKLAPLLAGKEDIRELNTILSDYIDEVLNELQEEAITTGDYDNDE